MKRLLLLTLAVLAFVSMAGATDTCLTCTTAQRSSRCTAVNGSEHCFCTVSNNKCTANGCPCTLEGADPPLAECFCPAILHNGLKADTTGMTRDEVKAKIASGEWLSGEPTVEKVKSELLPFYGDPKSFRPGQTIVVHAGSASCLQQSNWVMGMIAAAVETGHPIRFMKVQRKGATR